MGVVTGEGDKRGLLDVVDLGERDQPVVLGSLDAPLDGWNALPAWSVATAGDQLVISAAWSEIHVLDVADPAAPRRRLTIGLPSVAEGAAVREGVIYVAAGESGLLVIQGALDGGGLPDTGRIVLPVVLRRS